MVHGARVYLQRIVPLVIGRERILLGDNTHEIADGCSPTPRAAIRAVTRLRPRIAPQSLDASFFTH